MIFLSENWHYKSEFPHLEKMSKKKSRLQNSSKDSQQKKKLYCPADHEEPKILCSHQQCQYQWSGWSAPDWLLLMDQNSLEGVKGSNSQGDTQCHMKVKDRTGWIDPHTPTHHDEDTSQASSRCSADSSPFWQVAEEKHPSTLRSVLTWPASWSSTCSRSYVMWAEEAEFYLSKKSIDTNNCEDFQIYTRINRICLL